MHFPGFGTILALLHILKHLLEVRIRQKNRIAVDIGEARTT